MTASGEGGESPVLTASVVVIQPLQPHHLNLTFPNFVVVPPGKLKFDVVTHYYSLFIQSLLFIHTLIIIYHSQIFFNDQESIILNKNSIVYKNNYSLRFRYLIIF